MWVPLGEYPNYVCHHVPTIYGLCKAIWVNIYETTARVLSQWYAQKLL